MINATAQSNAPQQPEEFPVALVPRVNIHTFCDNQQTAETLQAAAMDRRMSKAHVTIQLGGILAAVQVYQTQPTPNVLVVESHSSRDGILSELSIIAFVGAKGGVGSSSIAHNIAWALSKYHDLETVITDLDLAFGTAGLNFNQDASGGILDALGQPDRVDATLLDRMLMKLGEKLSLLSGPGGVDRDVSIDASAIDTILGVVRHSVPCVVVDVPNMWAPWIKHTLLNADEVVITSTPELASLRNTKNLVDLLKASRPNDKPPRLILNQFGVPKRPEIPAADFAKAVGIAPSFIIPHDPQTFGTAQSNGQMIFEVAPKSKAAEMLGSFAQILAGNETSGKTAKSSRTSLFQKIPLLRKK
jgi:pilus assembly protein CpaE